MVRTQDLPAETLSALVDASSAINSAQGLDETLQAIAAAAAVVMKTEGSSVIMLDRIRGKQVFRAAVGDRGDQLIGVEYDQGLGISGKAMESGKTIVVNDVSKDKAHYKDIDALMAFRTRSLIAAPLINKGKKLGVVEVLNPVQSDRFNENDRRLAQIFANLAATAVANAQLFHRLDRENRGLKEAARVAGEMIGEGPAMAAVKELIRRVSQSMATVLLLGETGTGKELAARMVHALSPRRERPFIAVNCAALPETLLESELFGHDAGAFTGAMGRKLGRFELAEGGTIFLDEIAEVAPNIQVKLLRVLQEREIVRVGGTTTIGCDVRVIAATNRDLAEEMHKQRFRQDLFYRLNVFPIRIPPLRERREDIPLLAENAVRRLSREMKMPAPPIAPEAVAALTRYDFPGNVRELQNVMERACLLCSAMGQDGPKACGIRMEHLPREIVGGPPDAAAGSALASYEKAMILNALRDHQWNQTRAAKALGISRDNIRYRIRKFRIRPPPS